MTLLDPLTMRPPVAPLKSWFPSAVAREVMQSQDNGALWEAEWDRVLMLHWSVPSAALQKWVPFPLDEWAGEAYVSAVAFTMRGMRLPWAGRWLGRMSLPYTHHAFLNLRTYVKVGDEAGIFFLREWVPLVPTIALARPLYGLPFVPATLDYTHHHEQGQVEGEVASSEGRLAYRASVGTRFDACAAGSLTEFLMERYTAFTRWGNWARQFHVWHPPWQQQAVTATVTDASLLASTGDWAAKAHFAGAHYSPGLPSVWMGAPRSLPPTF